MTTVDAAHRAQVGAAVGQSLRAATARLGTYRNRLDEHIEA